MRPCLKKLKRGIEGEIKSCYVAQAVLELLGLGHPPALTSWIAGTAGATAPGLYVFLVHLIWSLYYHCYSVLCVVKVIID